MTAIDEDLYIPEYGPLSLEIDASRRTGTGTFIDLEVFGYAPEVGDKVRAYTMTAPPAPHPDDERWDDIVGRRHSRAPRVEAVVDAEVERVDEENELVFLALNWTDFDDRRRAGTW